MFKINLKSRIFVQLRSNFRVQILLASKFKIEIFMTKINLRKSSFAISEIESLKGKQITTFIFFFTKIRIDFREATTLMSDISGFFQGTNR